MKFIYRSLLLQAIKKESPKVDAKRRPNSADALQTAQKPLILILDDEPQTIEFIVTILDTNGFSSLGVPSVKQGIEKLQSGIRIVMIICDLMMPEDDGFVLLRFLRENLRFSRIPVIISSACAESPAVVKALKLGARDFLAKPYTSDSLLARVKKVLDAGLGRLLVVTEDKPVGKILSETLVRRGYRVSEASTGQEALNVLQREHFSIIISDLVHPDMTGLDFLAEAKEICHGIPVVFISDPLLPVNEADILAAGGHGLIFRPFNNSDVIRKIDHVCSN